MHTELVCVGTELLTGHLNTDSAFIGQKLPDVGIRLDLETTVADKKNDIEKIFQEVLRRSDLIFVTGGLGPTFDDLTREVLAKVLKKKLVFNKEVMETIAYRFAKRDIKMPKENDRQAYIIEGAKVIPNKSGTAPGMIIDLKVNPVKSQKSPVVIILLPGPPKEMQPMIRDIVLPYLKNKFERKIIKTHLIHVCGLTESEVDQKIKNIVETERRLEAGELTFALLAHPSVIDIKITASGTDEMVIDGLIKKAAGEIKDCLKDDVFAENNQTLQTTVGYLLGKKRKTLSIAESCTGGLLGNVITSSPGSSLYFKGGVIAYSNQVKTDILKIPEEILDEHGAVSKEVALTMAQAIKGLYQTDFALGITGIAGPGGGTDNKPVGLVYIALVSKGNQVTKECKFIGSRQEIKFASVIAALDLLRRMLLKN